MTVSTLLDGDLARRLERLSLVMRRRLAGEGQGDRRSVRKGSSMEFADYRRYTPGDDPAKVDWNIYARSGSLFVRVYEEEEVLNVHLLLDASRSMDWGEPNKLEYARRLAAALGYLALSNAARLHVGLLEGGASGLGTASTTAFGPAWGRQRTTPLLDFLGGARPVQSSTPLPVPGFTPTPPDVDASLASYRARASGLTVLISDLLSSTWERAVARLAARGGDGVVLHVLAPRELRPQLGSDLRLIDRETGATVPVTLNNDAIRIYGERLATWRGEVEALCARHRLTYVPLDTSAPIESVLFDTLRRRGVVR